MIGKLANTTLGVFIKTVLKKDQITRSGLSVPSNIAEGYERETDKEKAQFLNYAKDSAGELRTQIYIGMDVGYIDSHKGKQWIQEAEALSKMQQDPADRLTNVSGSDLALGN